MPSDFAPMPWTPEPAPTAEGALAANDALSGAELWAAGHEGPEDVIIDSNGSAISGSADGLLLRVYRGGSSLMADVGGRPLGVEWYGDDVLVCNAHLGLQLVSQSGHVTSLTTGFEEEPFIFTNNASVASDGTIYFSVSSQRRPIEYYVDDLLEGQPTGRLFSLSPDRELRLLVDDLMFANGVALAPDQASVFVAETGRYRIHRHWLTGARAGETEVFASNLPGFPDNISVGGGTLWVALASPRQPLVDMMHPRPWLRKIAHRLPESLKPAPVRHGYVLGYGPDGTITHNLQDPSGRVAITTGIRFSEGRLFLGSLSEPHVAVVPSADLGAL